jgi:hypothetical protein
MAARDTSTEISETARVLKEHGVIRDTASVVTWVAAEKAKEAVRESTEKAKRKLKKDEKYSAGLRKKNRSVLLKIDDSCLS